MHLKVFLKLKNPKNSSLFWANIFFFTNKSTQKNPKISKNTQKTKKTHWAGFFKKNLVFFQPCFWLSPTANTNLGRGTAPLRALPPPPRWCARAPAPAGTARGWPPPPPQSATNECIFKSINKVNQNPDWVSIFHNRIFWMRFGRVCRASDSQCLSRNCPGFGHSILRHNGI